MADCLIFGGIGYILFAEPPRKHVEAVPGEVEMERIREMS